MRAFTLPRSSSCPALLSVLALLGAACSPVIVGGGAGGGGGDGPSTSSAGTTSGGFSGCADPTPVGLPAAACTPTYAGCGAATSVCLATAHAQGASTFALRLAHVELSRPKSFTSGIVKSVFQSSTAPDLKACDVNGTATFNWLLRFDAAAGTLTVGAGLPLLDPTAAYKFIDGPFQLGGAAFNIAPVTLTAPLGPTCSLDTLGGDVLLPFFGDAAGNTFTILPLRSLRFFDTQVTPDHDCIGVYNAIGLDPANGCAPDDQHPQFIDGGHFDSFMSLETADTILVPPLGQTLCVLLTGDAATYGDGGQPQKCKRNGPGNPIVFQGDWCSSSNQAATAGCADAAQFAGAFAASGTKIN